VRGFIGAVFKTIHSRNEEGGSDFGERYQRRRERGDCGERDDRWGPHGGERGGGVTGLGWFGGELGWLAPGVWPKWLLASFFYFFLSVFFFFCF
jgi:hypothetical protein